ncbi:MAG: adenosylcobinamide-GDP ribazoletransferase [endosymbiont of Galathealinum brachiosum]|uniref:Adenosylcobinamide-GDP ribazoletransferase n=1 Tax=endosymbiont of Galathealinum brachiosum TaxID=2200906 RepID=A0A370DBB9_9GAMM|nr:MAG: adenosylcobinamide-GDP ribazoletransferase [endosymbiont of Galathealinum brachiosum]
MTAFLIALQFLTRFPLNFNIEWTDENVARSLLWYPVVGFLIGLCIFVISSLLAEQNSILVAAIILSVWVIITGGLHLDGLADSADAWVGSHGDKKRALEIMKDPQAGPIAVIVLVLVLLIKFSAINSLILNNEIYLLIAAPVIARCVPLTLFLTTPYVREQGLGSAMAAYLPRELAWTVLSVVSIVSLFFLGFVQAVVLILVVACVLWYLRYLMVKFIGGMTGDTIGAAIEFVEVVVLMAIVF